MSATEGPHFFPAFHLLIGLSFDKPTVDPQTSQSWKIDFVNLYFFTRDPATNAWKWDRAPNVTGWSLTKAMWIPTPSKLGYAEIQLEEAEMENVET